MVRFRRGAPQAQYQLLTSAMALALLATACGSTVQVSGQVTGSPGNLGSGESAGQQPGDSGWSGTSTPAAGATTPAANVPDLPGAAGPGQAREPLALGSDATLPPSGVSGRGYTAKEIYVGYPTWNDVNAAAAALGPTSGADFGNQQAVATAVIQDINRRGGVAGRKLVPVFYDYKTGQDISEFNQAACAYWTQDRPVYAVIDNLGKSLDTELLPACLAKRHTYYVATGAAPIPQRLLTKYSPYFYLSSGPTWERFAPLLVERAAARGYFTGWNTTLGAAGSAPVKVGILSSNVYFAEDWARVVAKELARSGHPAAEIFQLDGNGADKNGAAILRFRSDGITHVVPFGGAMLTFPAEAQSQGYRPRYLMGTGLLSLIQKLAPPTQLHGALGVGYLPPSDVDNAHDPGPISAAQTQCITLMHQAGQSTKSREALYMMMLGCDGFAFFKAATELGARAGKGLSPDSLRLGVPRIKGLPSAAVFGGLSYPAGRLDGATSVRDLGFDDGGPSFTYLDRINRPM